LQYAGRHVVENYSQLSLFFQTSCPWERVLLAFMSLGVAGATIQ